MHAKEDSKHQEILRLKKELKRVTEERDILLCLHSLREKRPPHPKGTSFRARTLQNTKAEVRVHSYTCFGISRQEDV
jgi:transposase-like protein